MSAGDDYDSLRRQADDARAHLTTTLDHLDRKRHDLVDVRLQLAQHPIVASSIAGGMVAVLGVVGLLVYRRATRERSTWRKRGRAIRRAWNRPERIASGKQGPFASELGRNVLLALAGFTLVELGKLGIRRLLPQR